MIYAAGISGLVAVILFFMWKAEKAKRETAELIADTAEARIKGLRRVIKFERKLRQLPRGEWDKQERKNKEIEKKIADAKPGDKIEDIFGDKS